MVTQKERTESLGRGGHRAGQYQGVSTHSFPWVGGVGTGILVGLEE